MAMKWSKWGGMVVVALVALLAMPWAVLAQEDLSETYTADDGGITFQYPAGWAVQADVPGIAGLSNSATALENGVPAAGEIIMIFFAPSLLSETGGDPSTLQGALDGFLGMIDADEVSEPAEVMVGERDGLRVDMTFEGVTSFAVALMQSDGQAGVVTASTIDDLATFEEQALAIMETFDGEAAAAASGEPCEVSTQVEWSASLRVGPGENRTEMTTLPVDEWYPVTGQATADDGSLWWQLDKAAVAPGSAAAELWVNQEQVDERGDCAAIGAADAPPIIPITVPQPTAVPAAAGQQPAAPQVKPSNSGTGVWVDFPGWAGQIPAGYAASSRASARIVLTVMPSLKTEGQETYSKWDGSTTTVYRNRVVYTVTALDPKTSAVLGTTTVEGGDPPGFPDSMPINATLNGSAPPLANAWGWVMGFLG